MPDDQNPPNNAVTLTDVEIKDRARDKRRNELAEMSLSRDPNELMVPINGRDLLDKANTMAQSDFMVKDIFRNNPGACTGLIMLCAPYRINPFAASWKAYQTKEGGPLAFEAQFITALLNKAAPISGRLRYSYEGEGEARVCIVRATDRDSGEILEYRSPPFARITPKNSPLWKSDPDQQQAYYSSRAFARRYYPEILLGVYDRDEIDTSRPEPRDITPARERSQSIIDALPPEEAEPVIESTPAQQTAPTAQQTAAPVQQAAPATASDDYLNKYIALIPREYSAALTIEDLKDVSNTYAPQLADIEEHRPEEAERLTNIYNERMAAL